jgi:plasmid stability protein
MAQLLVRDVDPDTIDRLKARARRYGRSLQGEVKVILIEATTLSLPEARAASARWQKRLAGRAASDSAALIREDRTR